MLSSLFLLLCRKSRPVVLVFIIILVINITLSAMLKQIISHPWHPMEIILHAFVLSIILQKMNLSHRANNSQCTSLLHDGLPLQSWRMNHLTFQNSWLNGVKSPGSLVNVPKNEWVPSLKANSGTFFEVASCISEDFGPLEAMHCSRKWKLTLLIWADWG